MACNIHICMYSSNVIQNVVDNLKKKKYVLQNAYNWAAKKKKSIFNENSLFLAYT